VTVARFEFHGVAVEVASASAELVEEVRRDFAWFHRPDAAPRTASEAPFRIELHLEEPSYDTLPALPAAFFTPRNVCFRDRDRTYIDYFGRALAVLDRAEASCIVRGNDLDLVHEIAYLLTLSTVGERLDRRGVHRVHALGVAHGGRGVLLLLPSGGGKSTMALRLLRETGFALIGEDTPLVDPAGTLLPFPLRLGVRPGDETGVAPEHLRTVRRMEFDPKTLVDIEVFRDRIAPGPVAPAALLVGERNLGRVSAIEPLARTAALKALVKYMVVGLGVYQGMEFLLERGVGDLAGKVGVASSRLRGAVRLLRRAPAYRFVLGRDLERNYRTLLDFLGTA
jgi:hypothetical protein